MGRRVILGFDAGCMACSELASRVEEVAGDRLEVMSLSDPLMREWRSRALGEDGPWAPTLVEVSDGEVKAHTGVWMGVCLARHLGPVATWRVMQILGDSGAAQRAEASPAARALRRMSRGQFLKGVGGAVVGVGVLSGFGPFAVPAGAREGAVISEGTPALRNKAKAIVRSSEQYRELLRETKQKFDFGRAKFTVDSDSGFAGVTVATSEIDSGTGIVATLLVDLRDKMVSYNHYMASARDNKGRHQVTAYENRKLLGQVTIADNHVIAPDGREFSLEQFKQRSDDYREVLSRESKATFSSLSSCSNCRTSRRNRCNWVIWGSCTVGGRVLWWLGAACGFLAMYSGNKGAGCAAWARSTCYKDGYC